MVRAFLYFQTVCLPEAKAQAILCICTGSHEPSLLADAIRSKFSCGGPYYIVQLFASVATLLLIALFVMHLINNISQELKEYIYYFVDVRLMPTYLYYFIDTPTTRRCAL